MIGVIILCIIAMPVLVVLSIAAGALRGWALRGTIPAASRQDAIDRWYSERYGEDIPPASWEDPKHPMYDMLDRELAAKTDPRLTQAMSRRDALLSEGRWADAVEATDQIIRLIDKDSPAVQVRPRTAAKTGDALEDIQERIFKLAARIEYHAERNNLSACQFLIDEQQKLLDERDRIKRTYDMRRVFEKQTSPNNVLVLEDGVRYDQLTVESGPGYTVWKSGGYGF